MLEGELGDVVDVNSGAGGQGREGLGGCCCVEVEEFQGEGVEVRSWGGEWKGRLERGELGKRGLGL